MTVATLFISDKRKPKKPVANTTRSMLSKCVPSVVSSPDDVNLLIFSVTTFTYLELHIAMI